MSDAECAICLEGGSKPWHSLRCGHAFHTECIVECLRRNAHCPVCRDDPHKESAPSFQERIAQLRRVHRNYVCRRNRLARENTQIGIMRTRVRALKKAYHQQRKNFLHVMRAAEARVLRDPHVREAKRRHDNVKRRYLRNAARFTAATESVLGPRPSMLMSLG